jgi:hypothetical protein
MIKKFYKTTITIVTDFEPDSDIEHLAREVVSGKAHCCRQESTEINEDEFLHRSKI